MSVVYNNLSHFQYYINTTNFQLSASVTMFIKDKTRAVKVPPLDVTAKCTNALLNQVCEENFPQYIHKLVYLTIRICERCWLFSEGMGKIQVQHPLKD